MIFVRSAAAPPLYRRNVDAMDQAIADGSFDSCRLAAEALNLTRRVPEARSVEAIPVPFSDHLNNIGIAFLETSEWASAVSAFSLSLEQDPDDAFALHYLGFSLDNEAQEPRRVESSYVQALNLDSTHVTWHERLVSFLVVQARIGDAAERFATSRGELLPDDGDASVEIYAHLHLPVAANLLRRTELLLTDASAQHDPSSGLIRDCPALARSSTGSLSWRLLQTEPSCVPADRATKAWWNQPELLGERDTDGRPLQVWLAAGVEAISSSGLDLQVAVIKDGQEPLFGTTTMSWETVQERAQDSSRLTNLDSGDFLEIGYYALWGRIVERSRNPHSPTSRMGLWD